MSGVLNKNRCPAHCPGCSDKGLTAEARLDEKAGFLAAALFPWRDRIEPIETSGPEEITGYRKRVCLAAGWTDGGWHLGLRHRRAILPIHNCPVHSLMVRRAVVLFADVLPGPPDFPLVYYVQTGAQVTLVLKTRHMPDCAWLTETCIRSLKAMGVEGLWLHLHPSAGNRVFAKNGWHLVWGSPWSVTRSHIVPLRYGPTAFQQLIPSLFNRALDRASDFLAPDPEDQVFDLYSGIGSTLVRWTRAAESVVGVETSGEAVACARYNAPAAKILRGTCAQRCVQLNEMMGKPLSRRLVWANPPRTGIEPEVVQWLTRICRPVKMACLSCNPRTLSRDLADFQEGGYKVIAVIPFDFFPNTRHIETLVLLTKLD